MNFDDFADFIEGEDQDLLQVLNTKAAEAVELMQQREELEGVIKTLSSRINVLTQKDIPAIMNEAGMKKFELSDGSKIAVKEVIQGSLNKAPDQQFAMNWLLSNDGGEIITTDVSVSFARGGHNEAMSLKGELEQNGHEVNFKEGVHAQTYSKFLRDKQAERLERIENGEYVEPIPFDQLGAYHGTVADIKVSKK